jgi:hypothetical protein
MIMIMIIIDNSLHPLDYHAGGFVYLLMIRGLVLLVNLDYWLVLLGSYDSYDGGVV